ncbi:ATP-binding protein [Herpetosiphon llansteffanensis]
MAHTSKPKPTIAWSLIIGLLLGPALLIILRLFPALDLRVQSPAGHFWIVTIALLIGLGMIGLMIRAALVRRDGRALMLGLGFLAMSLMFLVHAIATPGVMFSNTSVATQWSTPLALFVASIIFTLSMSQRLAEGLIRSWQRWMLIGFGLWIGYTLLMMAYIPSTVIATTPAPTTQPTQISADTAPLPVTTPQPITTASPHSLHNEMRSLAPNVFPFIVWLTVALFGWTAWFYGKQWRANPTLPLATFIIAAILLAETALAALYGELWQLSFWSYHVLLLAAIGTITYGVIRGVERTGSLTSAVEGLLLKSTLQRQQAGFQNAMSQLLNAFEAGDRTTSPSLRRELSQQFALAEDQLDLLQQAVGLVAQDREQSRRLQALVDISYTVTLELEADALMSRVVASLANMLQPALAAVGLLDAEHLQIQAQHYLIKGEPSHQALSLPLSAFPMEWLTVTDLPYVSALTGPLKPLAVNQQQAYLIPLQHRTQLIGILFLQLNADQQIDARSEGVLQSVAAHLANGIINSRLYSALQTEHQQLQRSEQLREQMNQMVVHDLKNPLTVIINYLDLLRRQNLPESQRELVEGARRSSRTLVGLVSDLLDTARLQEGHMVINREHVPIAPLLNNVANELRSWAEQEAKVISIQAEPELYATIDGDLMRRVLSNLLSNAIKHTPMQTEIKLIAHHAAGQIIFQVIDNGPGIPEALQESLFDRFTTLSEQQYARQRSTGLGLYFCKLAVEAHEGTIGVVSNSELGTTFTISMPDHN